MKRCQIRTAEFGSPIQRHQGRHSPKCVRCFAGLRDFCRSSTQAPTVRITASCRSIWVPTQVPRRVQLSTSRNWYGNRRRTPRSRPLRFQSRPHLACCSWACCQLSALVIDAAVTAAAIWYDRVATLTLFAKNHAHKFKDEHGKKNRCEKNQTPATIRQQYG